MADPTKPSSAPAAGTPPPFLITPLQQERKYLKVLIYGPFGSGKTSLAGSAADADMGDILMVDAESGSLSIADADQITNKDKISRVRCETFKQVAFVQEFLKSHCVARDTNNVNNLKILESRVTGVPVAEIEEPKRFRTVIVDSLTEIDTFSMYQLLNIKTDMKLDADMEVAQFAEFRKNNQLMQLLVRAYRDLPMNVILVCSAQFVQDEMKRMLWTPAVTGKLSAQIQGFVDVVGYLQVAPPKEGEQKANRRLWVQPVGKFDAKNRIASYKSTHWDDPTMAKIWAAYKTGNPK